MQFDVKFIWTRFGEWLVEVLDDDEVVDAFVGPAMATFDDLLEDNGWARTGCLTRTRFGQTGYAVRRNVCECCGNVTFGEVKA